MGPTWAPSGQHWLAKLLPKGRSLPEDVWRQRQRGILMLLWLHVPVLFAIAMIEDPGVPHAVFEAGIVAAFATMATMARRHAALSTVITSVGLMACSAELVHISGGLIEMHFHFFVMVGVVTLFQDWRPFLVAIGFVVLHHGLASLLDPGSVYNHPAAVANPWKWAAIHGGFIVGMSATGIITWRLNEVLLSSVSDREHKLEEAQEVAKLGSWEYRADHDLATWSSEMYRLLGVAPDFPTTSDAVAGLIHPDDVGAWRADVERASTQRVAHDLDFRIVLADGTVRWLHGRGAVTHWDGDQAAVMTGTIQDITDRRASEEALRASEQGLREAVSLLNATLDSTADGILVVDNEGRIAGFNGKFTEMWEIPQALLDRRDDAAAIAHVLDQLADPESFLAKVNELYAQPDADSYDTIAFVDGRVVERFSIPQRVDGEIVGRVWSFRDVTDRTRLEEELAHQAFHDSLTGLANQALFRDRLDHALARRRAVTDGDLAVLFLDLDNFKHVNDSLGHPAGDALLVAVTERLASCLREADTAARLGGDEFAILLEDVADLGRADEVAERILLALAAPYRIADKDVFATASVGIAGHTPGLDGEQMLRNADLAMYTAKRLGKNRFERFDPTMHTAAMERIEVEADLRRACARGELRLQYQPIVSLDDGELLSVEALVRWQHPTRGLLAPGAFIGFAEESDLIEEIGQWVLQEACAQTRRWQQEHPERRHIGVSVNVSPRQLRNPAITTIVANTLRRTGLDAEDLTLEITEGAMMHDTEVALARLHELKSLGVRLAVDDFGTGYSSLSYLQQFPIDVLKIDRSFVDRIEHGPEESSLARAIVRLAQSLHLSAVAEGVENAEQMGWLREIGCPSAQGFHLCRPVDPAAIGALLDQGAWISAPSAELAGA
ncbi:MAG: putative bifunctional diguanylate cyclase/phosphodiesterase [Acidimicrobiales bacterium]